MDNLSLFELGAIRLGSVIAILIFKTRLSPEHYSALYMGVLFAHYFLQISYSRNNISAALRVSNHRFIYISLVVLIVLVATFQIVPFLWLFLVHAVLTDTYLCNHRCLPSFLPRKQLIGILFFFNSSAMLFLLRSGSSPFVPEPNLATVALGIAFLSLIAFQITYFSRLGWFLALELLFFQLVLGISAVMIPQGTVTLQDIVFYHLILWILMPIASMHQKGDKAGIAKLLGTNLAIGIPFSTLYLRKDSIPYLGQEFWTVQVYLWAYIHFTLSFGASRLNPEWISAFFLRPWKAKTLLSSKNK